MTHNEYPSSDPLGYLLDLDEAIAQHDDSVDSAAQIVNAYGRCQVFGIELAEETARLVQLHIPAVQDRNQTVLGEFVQNARMLGQNWLAEQDPWEADEIVRRIVNLRTDVLGWELIFGNAIQANIDAFDAALRTHQDIIKTSLETNWFQNLREMIRPDLLQRAWWLDSTPLPVDDLINDLPPPEFYAEVRRVKTWKTPRVEIAEPKLLGAGATTKPKTTFNHQSFLWVSPDGTYQATLTISLYVTRDHYDNTLYPLEFTFRDDSPAPQLFQEPIRFGDLEQKISEEGIVRATLAAWRNPSNNGRLFVGNPATEWPLQTNTKG